MICNFIIGYDKGTRSDYSAIAYGYKQADGVVVITNVEVFTPDRQAEFDEIIANHIQSQQEAIP